MVKKYSFVKAESLIGFIEENKERFVGQHINAFYSDSGFGGYAEHPIVFELDDYSLIIHYFDYSDMEINIVDTNTVKNDLSLNFLYKDIHGSRNLTQWVYKVDFPYIGQVIEDIDVKRYSKSVDDGDEFGEYFSVITVFLNEGSMFRVCAAPPIYDGYIIVW